MDEHKGPLGMLGRDVDRRKTNQPCGLADFMTLQVEIDVHAKSLHETERVVNFENKTCANLHWHRLKSCPSVGKVSVFRSTCSSSYYCEGCQMDAVSCAALSVRRV